MIILVRIVSSSMISLMVFFNMKDRSIGDLKVLELVVIVILD